MGSRIIILIIVRICIAIEIMNDAFNLFLKKTFLFGLISVNNPSSSEGLRA